MLQGEGRVDSTQAVCVPVYLLPVPHYGILYVRTQILKLFEVDREYKTVSDEH